MNLPMVVLPRPAPGVTRATPGAQSATGPDSDDGTTDFADVLGAAVHAGDPAGHGGVARQPAETAERAETAEPAAAVAQLDASAGTGEPTDAEPTDETLDAVEWTEPLEPAVALPDAVAATAAATVVGQPAPPADAVTGGPDGGEPTVGAPADIGVDGRRSHPASPALEADRLAATAPDPAAEPVPAVPPAEAEPGRPAGVAAPGSSWHHAPTASESVGMRSPTVSDAPASDPAGRTATIEPAALAHDGIREIARGELQRIGSSRLGLDVSTDSLGNLRIEAVDRGGELQLSLGADHSATRVLLAERLPELREHLRAEGVQVGRLDISPGHDRTRDGRGTSSPGRPMTAEQATEPATDPTGTTPMTSPAAADGRVDVRL